MLTLEECMAKADEFCNLNGADPRYSAMVRAWARQPHLSPKTPTFTVVLGLASFLMKPTKSNFHLITRAWCKDFNQFYIDLLAERMKG